MTKHYEMWDKLGLDLDKHDEFLAPIPEVYDEMFLSQDNRPEHMDYYDYVVSDIHGIRVKELVEEKEKGNPVISSFCVFVPDEIVTGLGGQAIGLCAGAPMPVSAAEKELPGNDICPLIKSSLGFKMENICPYFEVSDFVIGETTCDGKKKAWEIMDDYIDTYVMELPQMKTESSRQLWEDEIHRFKNHLEDYYDRELKPADLDNAISLINEKRSVLKRLYNTRKAKPAPISGKDALLITQLAFFDKAERFIEKTTELCEELENRIENNVGVFAEDTPRILIAGTPMPLPSWKIHDIIEQNGAAVVCEETCTGTRYFEDMVPEDGNTIDEQISNLAERTMNINCACFTPNTDRVDDILRLAENYNVDGVVYYNLEFCQTYNMEYRRISKALDENGISSIHIESDYGDSDIAQLQTRIQAFIEML